MGGVSVTGYNCTTGTMFPVPFDYGYGYQIWTIDCELDPKAVPTWMIVDQVRALCVADTHLS